MGVDTKDSLPLGLMNFYSRYPSSSYVDLTPFWNGSDTFHRSVEDPVRYWEKMNYNYPEFLGLESRSKDEVKAEILKVVNAMYGPKPSVPQDESTRNSKPNDIIKLARTPNFKVYRPPTDEHTDWSVQIRGKRYELGMSYTVYLFLGEPPQDSKEWLKTEKCIGSHFIFVNNMPSLCENCQTNIDVETEGFVFLNPALEARGLEKRSPEWIKDYLKANLRWHVQKVSFSTAPSHHTQQANNSRIFLG